MRNGSTIKIQLGSMERLARKLGNSVKNYDAIMEARTKAATNVVWRTAQSKRAMITNAQAKAEGRARVKGSRNKYQRVSDPMAEAGVPVRTGALRGSITQKTERVKGSVFRGTVETHGIPYAGYIEYGTSRMPARPFMRPAISVNKEFLKKLYGMSAKVT